MFFTSTNNQKISSPIYIHEHLLTKDANSLREYCDEIASGITVNLSRPHKRILTKKKKKTTWYRIFFPVFSVDDDHFHFFTDKNIDDRLFSSPKKEESQKKMRISFWQSEFLLYIHVMYVSYTFFTFTHSKSLSEFESISGRALLLPWFPFLFFIFLSVRNRIENKKGNEDWECRK